MPLSLSMKKLSMHSLLCFIPYGYEFGSSIHLDITYNTNFLNSVFCCFPENKDAYDYLIRASRLDAYSGMRDIFCLGFPRFDLIEPVEENVSKRTLFLWTPRWSVNEKNDRSHFLDYYNVLLDYFIRHPDKKLIIRPHPLMFKNFLEKDILTESDVANIMMKVNSTSNIRWDSNKDYLCTFETSEVLITDYSTITIEFFAMNKPIIYCGNINNVNTIGRKMLTGVYKAKDAMELISRIDYLSENKSDYYSQNKKMIQEEIKVNNNIGKAIKDTLVDNYL